MAIHHALFEAAVVLVSLNPFIDPLAILQVVFEGTLVC